MRRSALILFLFTSLFFFAQKKKDLVNVSGTVYMNSTRSQGIANGKVFHDPQYKFKHQTIYFLIDSTYTNATTDSIGKYEIKLKPGTYTVYQSEGVKSSKQGLKTYGTYVIDVNKDGVPYDIYFQNTQNGRTAASGAMNGKASTTKSVKKE